MSDAQSTGGGASAPPPGLPPSTLCYLFGPKWAPETKNSPFADVVPGRVVDGMDTAANLLCVGFWSLWRDGWIALEQIGPVRSTSVMVFGGTSAIRVTARTDALTRSWQPAGLESALWKAIGRVREPDNWLTAKIRKASGEDRYGMRAVVLALNLPRSPWKGPLYRCRDDAIARGLLELHGHWWHKRLNVPDMAAAKAQFPAYQKVADARKEYREEHAELDRAMLADCYTALEWSRTSSD